MTEISSPVWILIGLFISIVSLFLGFIRPVEYNGFFQIMVFIGVGMIAFGVLKMNMKGKRELFEERRMKRGHLPTEVDIDMDDYRKHRAQAAHPHPAHHTQPHSNHASQQVNPGSHFSQANPQQKTIISAYCTQCGTPLMKEQKFCPMCGHRTS